MSKTVKTILALVVVVLLGLAAWRVLTMPDQRTTGQKIGDAIDSLSDGMKDAAKQLENRTPADKIGDTIDDMGVKIREKADEVGNDASGKPDQ